MARKWSEVTAKDNTELLGTERLLWQLSTDNFVTTINELGLYLEPSVRDFSGVTDTLVLLDRGNMVKSTGASANTVFIPLNSSVAFPVGTFISIAQEGAGVTTIEAVSGVTLNGVSAGSGDMSDQYASVTALKIATDTWLLFGSHGGVA